MTDATRRPGDTPPVEGHRTTPDLRGDTPAPDVRSGTPAPGVRSGTPAPGAPGFGTAEEAGRTTPDGANPPPTAHPKHNPTTPAGTGTHHDADRIPAGIGTGPHHGTDRAPAGIGTGTHHDTDRAPAGIGTGTHHDADRGSVTRLLRLDDTDKLTARLQHAVAGFVDAPRDAVQEADRALEELTARFTDAVTERRRTLRRSWQTDGDGTSGSAAATDTEQLRLALRDYRELAERLLHA
ncbi:hypothetical protein [Streptomyces sp. NRRL S-37]|uniref:hypothetical protein n=1 Tax=Streptomyces sp. NRRL S-37 TaxID=1463903 RepID=UPI0004CBB6D9|nr:hypothetical protein [Streptomyces sp. NRRL S-37]